MLADEDELLHAVAIVFVPVALEVGVLGFEVGELVGGHRGVPLPCIAQGDLLAGLLEDIAGVGLAIEPADALGTNDRGRPVASDKLIEEAEIQGLTTIIDEGADAVLFGFAFVIMMVVMVVVMMGLMGLMGVMMIVIMVVVVIIVVIIVVGLMGLMRLMGLMGSFNFLNPGSRGGDLVEVEGVGVEEFLEIYVAVVALDDLGLGLQGTDDLADAAELVGCNLGGFVQEYEVAELNLLDDEVLDVVFVEIGAQEVLAAAKLIAHTQGIHDGGDAIQHGHAVAHIFHAHRGDGADGLCDGCRLADAAGLDDDVVEALLACDVAQLLHEVHLQGAADAAVLQGHEVVVFLCYDTSLLNQVGIDIHFANIIDNHGKADAATVVEDAIQERGLAATKVAGEEKDRDGVHN